MWFVSWSWNAAALSSGISGLTNSSLWKEWVRRIPSKRSARNALSRWWRFGSLRQNYRPCSGWAFGLAEDGWRSPTGLVEQLHHSRIISSWVVRPPSRSAPNWGVHVSGMREVQQRWFVDHFSVKTYHQKRIIRPLDVAFKCNQLKVLQLFILSFIFNLNVRISHEFQNKQEYPPALQLLFTQAKWRGGARTHTHAPTHYCFDFLPPCHTKWWMHSNCSGSACSLPWDVTNDLSVGLNKREKERFRPKQRSSLYKTTTTIIISKA